MTVAPLVPLPQLAAMLADRIEALARELLPGGHRAGAEWVEARRAQGGLGDSLSVRLTGAKRGTWGHPPVAGAPGGDALDLVAYLNFNGDKGRAARWARSWLGIDGMDPDRLARQQRRAARDTARAQREQAADAEARRKAAHALWLAGRPIAGTPGAAYLAGRGIDLRALGKAPGALRFSHEVWCAEAGAKLPALLAAVNGPYVDADGVAHDGGFLTCHRTWLQHDGAGHWSKAALASAKKVYGPFRGGAIPLWRGRSGKPLRQAPADDRIVIAEGIEDALSIAMADPDARCLAAVSIANLGNIRLPAPPRPPHGRVTLYADNDGDNMQAAAALARGIDNFQRQGCAVYVARPPDGFKDANDLLLRGDRP